MSGNTVPSGSKDQLHARFITFNVNGLRTFFHYQPFSDMNQSLEKAFEYLDADIITLQELKTDRHSITRWGKVNGFYSFISLPQTKRGYSGVGCWVRVLPKEHPLSGALQVIKAEEGITGLLSVKTNRTAVCYRDDPIGSIGGYESLGIDEEDDKEGLYLDSEGRCVMVELACNVVVISVYCPANSSHSVEGASFRIKYLKVLFKRIRNLYKMGKQVVLMGDINVCRDLIDHAEALERASIKISNNTTGFEIESTFPMECKQFILNPDTPFRRILNQMLADSIIAEFAGDGILWDSTRVMQTRKRLKMYTVWNTLKNSRPINYGSRVDYVLCTETLKKLITSADILPDITGSDHCPVYADFDLRSLADNLSPISGKIPRFEARYKFDLLHRNVLEMFGKNGTSRGTGEKRYNVHKKPLVSPKATAKLPEDKLTAGDSVTVSQTTMTRSFPSREYPKLPVKETGTPPLCNHGLEAIQRTSRTQANPGKKFWICKLPKGVSGDKDSSCGFFQWA
ncbi:hypothetical protein HG537_0C02440 [Torulaspora globosa]|uniref:DNA-(apurinic or apyrimidinic site) endonuclease 2 n=1 Tax=Torulaspora globosa TaxID=48254 RepID=A0A7H9HSD5_9SACH|nr:hypothetical protein HG537_0C02440 [Torulaspora sp. CBS 2947]